MRHRKRDTKLGRTSAHRAALMSSLACALVERKRIVTTLAKAKQARIFVEKLVTSAKTDTLSSRRHVADSLRSRKHTKQMFDQVAPVFAQRAGGYTRILKLARRRSDGAEMAIMEWVGIAPAERVKREKKSDEKKS